MSEPKLISPMLDNFVMGDPISSHHGVRCCPAMSRDSDKKYIVKIISIPASQVQLDALLLTGAYPDQAAALAYFKELADGVQKEVQILQKLSKLEGFLPYESCQIVPMEGEVGYDVYLLGSYKRSLDKYFRKHTMTHLNAVNLGLDLCASMAVCRHLGQIYVDLKPSNIFVSDDQEYRIGDLGFVSLSSLKYASLPDKYRSPYTPPEIKDAYSSLNTTMDIYAIGMILYQVYNDGKLPFGEAGPGEEPLAPPMYADYEMAEIILKACAPDPKDRWSDPLKMGQALVNYMQRNGVNDVPIVPQVQEPAAPAPETVPETETPVAAPVFQGTPDDIDLDEIKAVIAEVEAPSESAEAPETEPEESAAPEDAGEAEPQEENEADEAAPDDDFPAFSDAEPDESDPGDLSFLDQMVSDETAPDESSFIEIQYHELSDETSDILSHADDLIAHETPEPVVPPEPIDVPIPPPIVPEPAEEPEEDSVVFEEEVPDAADTEESAAAEEIADDSPMEEPEEFVETPSKKSKASGIWLRILAVLLLASCIMVGSFFYYRYFYLQTIDEMTVEGSRDQIVVSVSTAVDESLLQVVCTDTHGNPLYADVVNGKATFTNLNPDTLYKIRITISGFHKLDGDISDSYITPAQTNVVSFNAIAGAESGSVILTFTVDGPENDTWSVVYSAEGEEEKTATFTGHMVTIPSLALDKLYTFRLKASEGQYLVGTDTITYTTVPLQYAQNLAITACENNSLTVNWNAPEGSNVESWTVRCYSESGFDQTVTIAETGVVFRDIDCADAYTVEVTAAGMTVSARTFITANSVTVSNVQANLTDSGGMTLSWDSTGTPEGGWLLVYTLDNLERQEVIRCDGNSASINPVVPGADYHFVLQAADGTTIFGNSFQQQIPEVTEAFEKYGAKASNMSVRMCRTPENSNWTHYDIKDSDYTTTFASGEKASLVLKLATKYNTSNDVITTLYVFRDANGELAGYCSTSEKWINMWYNFYCELNIPALPETPGSYVMELYMNGKQISTTQFEITENS